MSVADLPQTADFPQESAEFAIPPFPVRRFTVGEYERLTQIGMLQEDDSVELLEGWIVKKMTKNPLHDSTVDFLMIMLGGLLPEGWFARTQNVLLTSDSAPEPDVAIVPGKPRDYRRRHPRANEAALVIEVADSSLDRDWKKRRLYAHGGVPVYWIVDLNAVCLDVFSEPDPIARDFRQHERLAPPSIASFSLAGKATISVPLTEVLLVSDD